MLFGGEKGKLARSLRGVVSKNHEVASAPSSKFHVTDQLLVIARVCLSQEHGNRRTAYRFILGPPDKTHG